MSDNDMTKEIEDGASSASDNKGKTVSRGARVAKYIGFGVLCVVLALLIVNAMLSIFMPHYYPTIGKYRLFAIVTDSMQDSIPRGNMIVSTVPANETDIAKGDVITFEVAGENGRIVLITHRVVSVTADPETGKIKYVTKGDNAPTNDNFNTGFEDVVGVFTGKQCGFFGYFFGFAQSEQGAIMLILVLFIVVVAWLVIWYIDVREERKRLAVASLKKSEKELSNVNLRYDNIREITAVLDVLGMITAEPENRAEDKNIQSRLNDFINADTIELPQTPETAAILDSLPAPDTPLSLASALRSGATLRQAEDGQTLVLTGMSGGKSILLTPVQTTDGIILCQQGVRLRTNIAPNLEEVGVTSMPEYPEFFVGQPLKKNVDYPELPQPKDNAIGAEQLLAPSNRVQVDSDSAATAELSAPRPVMGQARIAASVAPEHLKELSSGRGSVAGARASTPEPVDPDGYRAKVAYAQYRELAAQLELRQVEKLSTLLDEVQPLTEEEQALIDKLDAEEKAAKKAKPKPPRKQKTPEEKAAAKARAEKRKADQEAFINALSPADRELYLSEQKLSKSRAATIRRLNKIAKDRKRLEKLK